jgi:hypothetical protein
MEHASRARLIFSAEEKAAELDKQLKGEAVPGESQGAADARADLAPGH